MLSAAPIMLPPEAVADATDYLRIVGGEEDALVARLLRSAAELCERFTGQALVARSFEEFAPGTGAWERLSVTPVRAVLAAEAVALDGTATALPVGSYEFDIDASGEGWVRAIGPIGAARLRVRFEAGMAAEWNGVPEALRQGVLRLAAHFYTHRDKAEDAGPPAAVTALWRPFRRMRLR